MRATPEPTTILVPEFPVAQRLRVKAKVVGEGWYPHKVFAEMVAKALAADEAEAEKRGRP
jgi:hypothetical protein